MEWDPKGWLRLLLGKFRSWKLKETPFYIILCYLFVCLFVCLFVLSAFPFDSYKIRKQGMMGFGIFGIQKADKGERPTGAWWEAKGWHGFHWWHFQKGCLWLKRWRNHWKKQYCQTLVSKILKLFWLPWMSSIQTFGGHFLLLTSIGNNSKTKSLKRSGEDQLEGWHACGDNTKKWCPFQIAKNLSKHIRFHWHKNHKTTGWWFQIFFIFTPIWGRFPFWRSYSSKGLVQPPTRQCSTNPGGQSRQQTASTRGANRVRGHRKRSVDSSQMAVDVLQF